MTTALADRANLSSGGCGASPPWRKALSSRLRISSPSWPVPDKVFATAPFGIHNLFPNGEAPLIFVTFMSFLLIISSGTMVRAVQEGARENKRGVVFWMLLTVLGGLGFLGCQAWEWNNLINVEHMTVTTNPFGTYTENGVYLDPETGEPSDELVEAGETYLLHKAGESHGEGHEGGEVEQVVDRIELLAVDVERVAHRAAAE